MHDCDVTIPMVQAQLDDLRRKDAAALRRRAGDGLDLDPSIARAAPNRTSYRGLEVLIVYLEARRQVLFDRFLAFWNEQERLGTWNRLDRAASRQLELAKERRRAEREAQRAGDELAQAKLAEREARERAERAQAELERTSLSG